MSKINFPTIDAALDSLCSPDSNGALGDIIKDFEMHNKEQRDLAQEFSLLLDQYNNMKASGQITPEVEAKLSKIIQDNPLKTLNL